jgi:hypothetical protein
MCTWYGGAVVKTKLLPADASMGFDTAPSEVLQKIDFGKASSEIPVYNTITKEVKYGLDALLLILSQRHAWLVRIAQKQPFYFLLQKLYLLTSYNRRGIVAHTNTTKGVQCAEAYSYNYKKFFIVLCYFLSFLCLTTIHGDTLSSVADWLYLISGFVCLYAVITTSKLYLEFAMQWQLQCLIMIVLLIPFTLLLPYVSLGAVLYLGLMAILFIVQIRRRIRYLLRYQQV